MLSNLSQQQRQHQTPHNSPSWWPFQSVENPTVATTRSMLPKSPEPAAAEPMPLHQNATAPRHKMPLTMARYTSPCDEDAVLLPAVFGSEVAFSAPETMHAWRIATATNSHFRRTMLEVSVNYSYVERTVNTARLDICGYWAFKQQATTRQSILGTTTDNHRCATRKERPSYQKRETKRANCAWGWLSAQTQ